MITYAAVVGFALGSLMSLVCAEGILELPARPSRIGAVVTGLVFAFAASVVATLLGGP